MEVGELGGLASFAKKLRKPKKHGGRAFRLPKRGRTREQSYQYEVGEVSRCLKGLPDCALLVMVDDVVVYLTVVSRRSVIAHRQQCWSALARKQSQPVGPSQTSERVASPKHPRPDHEPARHLGSEHSVYSWNAVCREHHDSRAVCRVATRSTRLLAAVSIRGGEFRGTSGGGVELYGLFVRATVADKSGR